LVIMRVWTIGLARFEVGFNIVLFCQVATTNGHPKFDFSST
jgi:hypothetical protein